MVMYVLYTSHQQNTCIYYTDGDVYIIHITPQQNTLDGGDVYIIHITPTEYFRW